MKKAILKLEVLDDKQKKEVMDTVSGLSGVDSISMDMKEKKLTVIGDIDPVNIVSKLRKLCHSELISVGPVKEPEKKKKKKDDDGYKKKDEPKIEGLHPIPLSFNVDTSYNPHMPTYPREITKPPPPENADDEANGYGFICSFAVDTSYNPHMPTYSPPKSADDNTSYNPREITKPPPPKSPDDDTGTGSACACVIL